MLDGFSIRDSRLSEHLVGHSIATEMTLNKKPYAWTWHRQAQGEPDLQKRMLLYTRTVNSSLQRYIRTSTGQNLQEITEKRLCHPVPNEWELRHLGAFFGIPKRRACWIECRSDADRQREMLAVVRISREHWNRLLPEHERIELKFELEISKVDDVDGAEAIFLEGGFEGWRNQVLELKESDDKTGIEQDIPIVDK